ncbi:helix-turn-helix domain-containing protein [Desulfovibrio desulfuricans]
MSQEILAEKIGITQQALARMEQGKIAPKLTRLPELAGALHVRLQIL